MQLRRGRLETGSSVVLTGIIMGYGSAGYAHRETALHANFGVELHGLSAATDPAATTVIADALARHGLVLLRGQHSLTPQQQFDLVLSMPDVDVADAEQNPFSFNDPSCLPGLPGVRALGYYSYIDDTMEDSSQCVTPLAPRPEQNKIGREFHTDGCGITALHAVRVPPAGAPTRRATAFACGQKAFEMLDPNLQRTAVALHGRLGPK